MGEVKQLGAYGQIVSILFPVIGLETYLIFDIPLLKCDYGMGSGVNEPEIIYKVPDNLSSNQRLILEFILMDNRLYINNLSKNVETSKRKMLDNINKLKEPEQFCRIGDNRNGYWEVKKKYYQLQCMFCSPPPKKMPVYG